MPDASITADLIVGFPGETEDQFQRTIDLIREAGFDRVNTAAYSPRPNTEAAVWAGQVADLIKSDRLQRVNAVVNEVATERAQRFMVGWPPALCMLLRRRCRHVRVQQSGAAPESGALNRPSRDFLPQGRVVEVLVEGPNKKDPAQCMGRNRHNRLVYFQVRCFPPIAAEAAHGAPLETPRQLKAASPSQQGDISQLRKKLVHVKIERGNAYSLFGTLTEGPQTM